MTKTNDVDSLEMMLICSSACLSNVGPLLLIEGGTLVPFVKLPARIQVDELMPSG